MRTIGPWSLGGISFYEKEEPTYNIWGPTPPGKQSGHCVAMKAKKDDAKAIAALPALIDALEEIIYCEPRLTQAKKRAMAVLKQIEATS